MLRNLKRNAGDYIGRAILECLEDDLTRGEVIEIRDYYPRADIWEKREILKIVHKKISSGENRPFLKDALQLLKMIKRNIKKYLQ